MQTIWKYNLSPGQLAFGMPASAQILSVREQHETPCMWALVDPNAPRETRRFEVYGTGHVIPPDPDIVRNFIGSFMLSGGAFVFHVFEVSSARRSA